jgi:hypothetical protein
VAVVDYFYLLAYRRTPRRNRNTDSIGDAILSEEDEKCACNHLLNLFRLKVINQLIEYSMFEWRLSIPNLPVFEYFQSLCLDRYLIQVETGPQVRIRLSVEAQAQGLPLSPGQYG